IRATRFPGASFESSPSSVWRKQRNGRRPSPVEARRRQTMTERKPHPDNDLIDELQEEGPAPSQGGSAGGQVNRDVGSRTDLHRTIRDTGMERPTGQDNPAEDAMKGQKTIDRIDPAKKGPSSE